MPSPFSPASKGALKTTYQFCQLVYLIAHLLCFFFVLSASSCFSRRSYPYLVFFLFFFYIHILFALTGKARMRIFPSFFWGLPRAFILIGVGDTLLLHFVQLARWRRSAEDKSAFASAAFGVLCSSSCKQTITLRFWPLLFRTRGLGTKGGRKTLAQVSALLKRKL